MLQALAQPVAPVGLAVRVARPAIDPNGAVVSQLDWQRSGHHRPRGRRCRRWRGQSGHDANGRSESRPRPSRGEAENRDAGNGCRARRSCLGRARRATDRRRRERLSCPWSSARPASRHGSSHPPAVLGLACHEARTSWLGLPLLPAAILTASECIATLGTVTRLAHIPRLAVSRSSPRPPAAAETSENRGSPAVRRADGAAAQCRDGSA